MPYYSSRVVLRSAADASEERRVPDQFFAFPVQDMKKNAEVHSTALFHVEDIMEPPFQLSFSLLFAKINQDPTFMYLTTLPFFETAMTILLIQIIHIFISSEMRNTSTVVYLEYL